MTCKTSTEKEIGKVGLKLEWFQPMKWQKGVKKMTIRCATTSVHAETLHQKDGLR